MKLLSLGGLCAVLLALTTACEEVGVITISEEDDAAVVEDVGDEVDGEVLAEECLPESEEEIDLHVRELWETHDQAETLHAVLEELHTVMEEDRAEIEADYEESVFAVEDGYWTRLGEMEGEWSDHLAFVDEDYTTYMAELEAALVDALASGDEAYAAVLAHDIEAVQAQHEVDLLSLEGEFGHAVEDLRIEAEHELERLVWERDMRLLELELTLGCEFGHLEAELEEINGHLNALNDWLVAATCGEWTTEEGEPEEE